MKYLRVSNDFVDLVNNLMRVGASVNFILSSRRHGASRQLADCAISSCLPLIRVQPPGQRHASPGRPRSDDYMRASTEMGYNQRRRPVSPIGHQDTDWMTSSSHVALRPSHSLGALTTLYCIQLSAQIQGGTRRHVACKTKQSATCGLCSHDSA